MNFDNDKRSLYSPNFQCLSKILTSIIMTQLISMVGCKYISSLTRRVLWPYMMQYAADMYSEGQITHLMHIASLCLLWRWVFDTSTIFLLLQGRFASTVTRLVASLWKMKKTFVWLQHLFCVRHLYFCCCILLSPLWCTLPPYACCADECLTPRPSFCYCKADVQARYLG